jgi:hypothetical protein
MTSTLRAGTRVIGVAHNRLRGNDFFTLGVPGTIEGVDQHIHVRWDDGATSLCWMGELENAPS